MDKLSSKLRNIKVLLFDWGDTLMRDFKDLKGPMCFWGNVEVIDGVEEFLDACYEKYPLVVATNAGFSDTELMTKALYRGEIDKYFSFFFSSKELGVAKPDPLFFQTIAGKINAEPSSIAVIGNDYKKDIEPSKKAGMMTFFFNETNIPGLYPDADYIFIHFSELHEMFINHF